MVLTCGEHADDGAAGAGPGRLSCDQGRRLALCREMDCLVGWGQLGSHS